MDVEEHITTCAVCLDKAIKNYVDVLRNLAILDRRELGSGLTTLRCGKVVNLIDE